MASELMSFDFKKGDKVFILPTKRHDWEWDAPKGVQTLSSVTGLVDARPYVSIGSMGYLAERCVLAKNLTQLEKIIYGI